MRSSARPFARKAISIHARPCIFSLPLEICSAPIPFTIRMWVNQATAFFSAHAVVRSGEPGGLPIAFRETAYITALTNCG